MDQIAHKLHSMTFPYAEMNAGALRAMYERIAAAARKPKGGTLTYAELVANLDFRERNRQFKIAVTGFTPHNRKFVSWMLGQLSKQTYLQGMFFAGAMVVDKKGQRPGKVFFQFARELGALGVEDDEDGFWKAQRAKAHEFFRAEPLERPRVPIQLPEFLSQENGLLRLSGHRIGLAQIIQHYHEGFSAEMLKQQFPTLSLSLVHKVLGFYLDSADWIDAYVSSEQQQVELQRAAAPRHPTFDQLQERFQSRRQSRAG